MRRLTVRFLFLVLIITFGFSASLFANSILYTFSTLSGVAGSFTLNDSTPFRITNQGFFSLGGPLAPTPYVEYLAESALISGTYGAYSFSGAGGGGLDVLDYQPRYDSALDRSLGDWWILRANVSGPELNGRSVTALSIFEYLGANNLDGPSFIPPPPIHNPFDFQFFVGFSDGTHESGGLETLTLVPELSSALLLGFGLLGIIALKRNFTKLKSRAQS